MSIELIIGLAALAGALIFVAYTQRHLTRLKEDATAAKANIDVELDRRGKVLESLGLAARKFMDHEKDTFSAVAELRSAAKTARARGDVAAESKAELAISSLLPSIMATVEGYPELKSDSAVNNLMEEVAHTENRLGFAKSFYNGAVREFNEARKMFPVVLAAQLFSGFRQDMAYWEVTEDRRGELEEKTLKL